jgi:hypothetical protein
VSYLFSIELIEETIKVFQEEDGVILSQDEAEVALEGLSGLFLAYAEADKGAELGQPSLAGEPAPYDLIITHNLN